VIERMGVGTGVVMCRRGSSVSDGTASAVATTVSGQPATTYGPLINVPVGITAGPDGALWFANYEGDSIKGGSIGRITTTGAVTNYAGTNIVHPLGITIGPDGALWFTSGGNATIGRITTPTTTAAPGTV
jgi:streptogramin lyase